MGRTELARGSLAPPPGWGGVLGEGVFHNSRELNDLRDERSTGLLELQVAAGVPSVASTRDSVAQRGPPSRWVTPKHRKWQG